MRPNRHPTALCVLALCGALALLAGCEPLDDDGGGGGVPPTTSSRACVDDEDCVADACCGQGTAITHVDEADAPQCSGACTGGCPSNSVDCGRCIPVCRFELQANGRRCAAACSG